MILIWVTITAITTVTDHSGYHLPFLKSPQFHDNHHAVFSECFGSSGLMDFIFRTDVNFRRSINFRRHRVLLSLKRSIQDLYPKHKVEVDQCQGQN
jgi:fatty acid hydroxylase domain-containing protein 2